MIQQFSLHVRVLPSIIYDFLIFRNVIGEAENGEKDGRKMEQIQA